MTNSILSFTPRDPINPAIAHTHFFITQFFISSYHLFFSTCRYVTATALNELHEIQKSFSKHKGIKALDNIFNRATKTFSYYFSHKEDPVSLKEDSLKNSRLLKELSPSAISEKEDDDLETSLPSQEGPNIDQTLFSALFTQEGSFSKFSSYLSDFFRTKNKLDLTTKNSLEEARQKEINLADIIEKKDEKKLLELAQSYALAIKNLPQGKPFIFTAKVSTGNGLGKLLKKHIVQHLPQELERLISSSENTNVIAHNLYERLLSFVQKEIGDSVQLKKCQEDLSQMVSKAVSATIGQLPTSWGDAIKGSLKNDLKELCSSTQVGNQVWDRLLEDGLQKNIETAIEELIKKMPLLLNKATEKISDSISSSIPVCAQEFLNSRGLSPYADNLMLEIQKMENGKYRLIIFCKRTDMHENASSQIEDITVPLIYSDIDENDLQTTFFYRIFTYEAWPIWKNDINYSMDDFFHGLIQTLNKKPDKSNFSNKNILTKNELFLFVLRYHLNSNEQDFEKDLFEIRKNALVNIWKNKSDLLTDSSFRKTFESAINTVSASAVALYKNGQIKDDELDQIYSTITFFEKQLQKNQITAKPGAFLPEPLTNILKEFLHLEGSSDVALDTVKDLFVDIFGKEITAPLNFTLKEIILEDSKKKKASQELSWSEIFSLDPIKTQLNELSHMRISLLHGYRLYSKTSYLLFKLFKNTIVTALLHTLLINFFPTIGMPIVFAFSFILTHYGTKALKKILPKDCYNLLSFLAFYRDVINYVKWRLTRLFFKAFVGLSLGSKNISHISNILKDLQEKTTKDGEINFDLNNEHYREHLLTVRKRNAEVHSPLPKNDLRLDDLPRPGRDELSPSTINSTLNKWMANAELIQNQPSQGPFHHNEYAKALVYLNKELRNLPIPTKDNSFWKDVKEVDSVLETLQKLTFLVKALSSRESYRLQLSQTLTHKHTETIVSFNALYAIIDHLARCSNSDLDDSFKPNGCNLMEWANQPHIKIDNPQTNKQLRDICLYFGFDLQKRYTLQEINSKRQECLFNYSSHTTAEANVIDLSDIYHSFSALVASGNGSGNLESINLFYPGNLPFDRLMTKEALYYKKLLKKENIQKILAAEIGNKAEHDKFFYLFCDPSLKEALEKNKEKNEVEKAKIQGLREQNSSSQDSRKGILPRSYRILRDTFLCSSQMIYCSSGNSEEVTLTQAPSSKAIGFGSKIIEKVWGVAKGIFHASTFNKFRRETINHNIQGFRHLSEGEIFTNLFFHQSISSTEETNKKTNLLKAFGHQILPTIAFNPRAQVEILRKPVPLPSLTSEQQKVFEMIYSQKSDQIMRTIAFFNQNLLLLLEPTWRTLFETLLQNTSALQSQLEDSPSSAKNIAKFFTKSIDFFLSIQNPKDISQNCLHAALDLASAAEWCKRFSQEKDISLSAVFPSFRNLISDKIIPKINSNTSLSKESKNKEICHALRKLVLSYMDISNITDEIAVDFCRLFYSLSWKNDQSHHETDALLDFAWEFTPLIIKKVNEDANLRKKVIETILIDAEIPLPSNYNGTWNGSFPNFECMGLKIQLIENTASESEDTEKTIGLNKFFPNPGPCRKVNSDLYYYPEIDAFWDINAKILKKSFNNKTYILLDVLRSSFKEKDLEYKKLFWIEEDYNNKPIFSVICTTAEAFQIISEERAKIGKSDQTPIENIEILCKDTIIHETIYREIDLSQYDHNLSLLSWFVPLKSIKAYVEPTSKGIKRLEFPFLNMAFNVNKNESGEDVAFSENFPGYYIAKNQKDPLLLSYPDFLLLENSEKEKKVIFLEKPQQILWANFLTNSNFSSPLAQSIINNLCKDENDQSYFVFNLSKDGKLQTSNPEAGAYLLLYHFIHDKTKELKDNLRELEDFGRCYPFSKKVLSFLDTLNFFLLTKNDAVSQEIALRISAIRTENTLVHAENQTTEEPLQLKNFNSSPTQDFSKLSPFLEYLLIQKNYLKYLEDQKKTIVPFLSENQELFILKRMSKLYLQFFENIESINNESTFNLLSYFGVDALATSLFMPTPMYERLQELKLKFKEEEDTLAGKAIAFIQKAQELATKTGLTTSLASDVSSLITPKSSYNTTLSKIANMLAKFYQHPLTKFDMKLNLDTQFINSLDVSEETLEKLSLNLWDLTCENINRYFFLYYRLATGAIPKKWKNTEKEKFFLEKVKLFKSALPLLQGNFDGNVKYFISFLEAASKGSRLASFPAADDVDKVILRKKEELLKRIPESYSTPLNYIMDSIFRASQTVASSHLLFSKDTIKIITNQTVGLVKNYAISTLLYSFGLGSLDLLYRARKLPSLIFNTFCKSVSSEKPSEAVTFADAASTSNSKNKKQELSETLKAHLTQREKMIDSFMNDLRLKYFKKNESKKSDASSYVEPLRENGNEATQDVLSNLNRDIQAFYNRPKEDLSHYQFTGDKNQFFQDLEDLQDVIQNRINSEKASIVSLVNSKENLNTLQLLEKRGKNYSFEEIFSLFAKGKENSLVETKAISFEKLSLLKEKLYLLIVLSSRFNLIFEKHKDIKSSENFEEMAFCLDRRRVYQFDDTDERLIRGELLFESAMKVLVWQKPHLQLQQMLLKNEFNYVLEAIMASGKTFFMIPKAAQYLADGENLVINVFPSDVANTNIDTIRGQSRKAYDQSASAFSSNRQKNWTKSKLDAQFLVLDRVLSQKENLNTTDKDLQSFELQFLENAFKVQKYSEEDTLYSYNFEKNQLDSHRKVLALIRQKGKANIDEPHKLLSDPKTELIFPFGEKMFLHDDRVELMEETMFLLISSKEFQDILTIKSKKPTSLDPEIYNKKIKPLLAEKMCSLLDIPSSSKTVFISYILSNEKTIPDFVLKHPKRPLIGLARGLLSTILPSSLEKIIHRDFDASNLSGGNKLIKPAKGNKNTLENTLFRNPFEAYIKTCLVKLNDRLTESEMNEYIGVLKDLSYKEAAKRKIPSSDTSFGIKFREITKFDLFEYKTSDLPSIYKALHASDFVTLNYVSKLMARHITYYKHNLRSDCYTFGSMFNSFYSYDGSPHKVGAFPEKTQILFDSGTKGQSVHTIYNKCRSIDVLNDEDPKKALDEILNYYFSRNLDSTAIIDRGDIFNGLTNYEVAKRILEYIVEHRPDMQGVVFYDSKKELVILEKGSKAPISLKDSRVPPSKRISYFDESHTYAADIVQKDNAMGVISIGEFLTLEDLFQALWRLRKLSNENGQTFIFVMTKTVKNLISKDKSPTFDDIIKFCARNEAAIHAEHNYLADRQKISNFIRRKILDKILFAKDIDTSLKIAKEFKDFILEKIEDDPFALYGHIDEMVSPKTLLGNLKENLFNMINKSSHFSKEDKSCIKDELAKMGNGKYPETIRSYKREGVLVGALDDLNREVQVEIASSSERDIAKEVNTETNLNQETTATSEKQKKAKSPSFWPWPKDLKPSELSSWLKVSPPYSKGFFTSLFSPITKTDVPIYSLSDALKVSENETLKKIALSLSPTILATNNFLQIVPSLLTEKIDPFSKYQKPLFEVLVIQEGSKRQILLLDLEEANYWREKLREDRSSSKENPIKIALYDIQNRAIVANGKNPIKDEDLNDLFFQRAITQLCFLNAQVKFENDQKEILKKWFEKCGFELMEKLFKQLHGDHGIEDYDGSDMQTIFEKKHPQRQLIMV